MAIVDVCRFRQGEMYTPEHHADMSLAISALICGECSIARLAAAATR